jgi:DNA polymerase elongation subunit (family B)
MSMDKWVDLSTKSGTDSDYFEGGYVLEPRPGCYKGVIVIDGNSLYGSIMVELGIFVDRCISSPTLEGLLEKANMTIPVGMNEPEINDLLELPGMVVMRSTNKYLGVMSGGPTLLSGILKPLISMRKQYRKDGDEVTTGCCKVLTTSAFGVFGSRHGDISSKTCAEIITFAARFYLRMMISVARSYGYNVIYGDTDSIFIEVKGEDEESCMNKGEVVKQKIVERVKGTVFENVGADIKGNYMPIVITSKKKYEAVMWSGEVETKGLAPVKKDTLPIVKYVISRVLTVLNGPGTKTDMNEKLIEIRSTVVRAIKNNKLPASLQVIEKRINGQPHYVYIDSNGKEQAILVDIGIKVMDVSKKWVTDRVKMAINRVLKCLDMNTFEELMFAYKTKSLLEEREHLSRTGTPS